MGVERLTPMRLQIFVSYSPLYINGLFAAGNGLTPRELKQLVHPLYYKTQISEHSSSRLRRRYHDYEEGYPRLLSHAAFQPLQPNADLGSSTFVTQYV